MRPPDAKFIFGRDREIEKIKSLIDGEVSFLLLGDAGVGKTHLVKKVVLPFLDNMSIKMFGADNNNYPLNRCYRVMTAFKGSPSGMKRFEYYLTKTYNIQTLPEKIRDGMDADLWTERIKTVLKMVAGRGYKFYIVIDQMELMPMGVSAILKEWLPYATFITASRTMTYSDKSANFIWNLEYETVNIRPLSREDASEFYDVYCEQINIPRKRLGGYFYIRAKTKILSQIFGVPQAITYALARLKRLPQITKSSIRSILPHRCGILERDLTIAFFLLIFCFVAMRFLTMRTFERWIYAVFAILSMGGMYLYRIAGKRFILKEENELVMNRAEGQTLPALRHLFILIHIIVSVLFLNILLSTFLIKTTWTAMLVCGLFSLLPDIDIEVSTISKIWRFIWRKVSLTTSGVSHASGVMRQIVKLPDWLESNWGHRTYAHSFWAILFIIIIMSPVAIFGDWRVWFGAVCGVAGHIIYDALSPSGVKLCYPARHSYVCPGPRSWRIPVGSKRELIFASCIVFPLFLFFIHIGLIGWSRAYLNLTGDPNALSRVVAGYINDNEVSVLIDGMWRISLRPAVQERFNVVAVMGDEMYAEQRGKMYRLSPNFLFSSISVRKGKLEVGRKTRTTSRTIEIKESM
ncbi:MAG: metal-dependent hydrolase, partial [Planctomycetota bacterium]|nr:metal-dependent hydrolase [Planctomycetota bacterium]